MTDDSRRDPRFPVADPNLVTVSVSRKSDGSAAGVPGVLLDVSCGGLRLKMEELFPRGEEIRLAISAPEFKHEIYSNAIVCWAEPGSGDDWVIGCGLKDKIAQDSIDELAAIGALDRRVDARRPMSFVAAAKSELETDFKSVQIVDISASGFCAVADQLSVRLNDRVMLKIVSPSTGDESFVRSRVVWIDELEGGRSMGCTFLTKADHSLMHTLANQDRKREKLLDLVILRPVTSWSIVGLAVVLILVVQLLWR